MEDKKQLQIGDKITKNQYGSITGFLEVTRVTAKRAFCLSDNGKYETQFEREYKDGWVRVIGGGSYSPSYTLTTQKDLDEVALKAAKTALSARFDIVKPKLSLSDCEAIMAVLDGIK